MKNLYRGARGVLVVGLLLTAATVTPAQAQQTASAKMAGTTMSVPKLPTNVLLFPATLLSETNASVPAPAVKLAQDIVTDAVRRFMEKGGVGVVVYNSRLPSVQRAVNEGQGIRADDALKGPGDDTRLAQKFAEVTGASEYVSVAVDNYVYDAKTRRATFNLTIERRAPDGSAIASAAEKAVGDSPSDVAGPRQQESALARAAEVVAEQAVKDVYPQSVALLSPKKKPTVKKQRSKLGWLIPIGAVGGLLAFPR